MELQIIPKQDYIPEFDNQAIQVQYMEFGRKNYSSDKGGKPDAVSCLQLLGPIDPRIKPTGPNEIFHRSHAGFHVLNGEHFFTAIMECLLEQEVDTVFGYPGGTILNLYDELYNYKDKINHILTAHEQGASHAADGYARSTGKVGVCFATSGPGATNLVTGRDFKLPHFRFSVQGTNS